MNFNEERRSYMKYRNLGWALVVAAAGAIGYMAILRGCIHDMFKKKSVGDTKADADEEEFL